MEHKLSNAQSRRDDPTSAAVQSTSEDAANSKYSSASLGYYRDDFLRYFITPPVSRRSPLINRGYWARVASFQEIIQSFLKEGAGNVDKQILSLGAGLDTMYFRLKQTGNAPAMYFEVDFPSAMSNKFTLISKHKPLLDLALAPRKDGVATFAPSAPSAPSASSEASAGNSPAASLPGVPSAVPRPPRAGVDGLGPLPAFPRANRTAPASRGVAGGSSSSLLQSPDYRLVGCDLRDLHQLQAKLKQAGFDTSRPTLVLSECVLVYLHPEESDRVIGWAASQLTGGVVFATYEQILPDDAFGRIMMKNLQARGCSLLGTERYPTLESHEERLKRLGFTTCTSWDMNQVYKFYLNKDEVKRIEKLELFDELEEWNLINAHYCISMGAKDPCSGPSSSPSSSSCPSSSSSSSSSSLSRVGLLSANRTPSPDDYKPLDVSAYRAKYLPKSKPLTAVTTATTAPEPQPGSPRLHPSPVNPPAVASPEASSSSLGHAPALGTELSSSAYHAHHDAHAPH